MAGRGWNPAQYLKGGMGALRTRPAVDLLAQIDLEVPRTVFDLGCGPGNSTALLKARWPAATVVGVDSSEAMLEKARAGDPSIDWRLDDIASWRPGVAADVIFANASFHWVPNHATLFRRLFACLAPGGVLAVQMPNNFAAPSHRLIAEIAEEAPGWRERLAGKLLGDFVEAPAFYHDLLRPLDPEVDVWQTEYLQPLTGEDPVLEWVKGTTLLPVERELDAEAFAAFTATYRLKLRAAYPRAADGVTLFPFRRLFVVARA